MHLGLAALSAFYGFLVALASVVFELISLARRRALRWKSSLDLAALWVLVFSPFAGVFLSGVIADARNQIKVESAREVCQELVQRLEDHRRATGSYPERIEHGFDDLGDRGPLAIDYYRDASDDRFRLGFSEVAENMSGFALHLYDSERGAWFTFEERFAFSFENDQLPYWLGEGVRTSVSGSSK